ncbi:MAG TPA: tetratricopeptide repeat protein, partial [Candidatus Caenarcaniphilales bacterium]
ELQQAKATRSLKALQTIQREWQRVQADERTSEAITLAVQTITLAEPVDRLTAFLRAVDPNQPQALNLQQLKQLATVLPQQGLQNAKSDFAQEMQQLSQGLSAGLQAWQRLEAHLVSWIYNQQAQLGFAGVPEQRGPWALWASQVRSSLPQALFQTLALNHSLSEAAARQSGVELRTWVELVVVLQCLQRGLVAWFDKMVYDAKVGARLSISTFLVFSSIWSQLGSGFSQNATLSHSSRAQFAQGCFQITQQILRNFVQREYFPLYGGIFASFSGNYLRDTLNYLDEPLRQVSGTQEKARILTLLGYSLRAQGLLPQALAYHQQALEIARQAEDVRCEIASLNHLSRTYVAQKNYAEAINNSQ